MNKQTLQRLYAAGQRNFRHADLRGLSLQNMDLAGADFTGAKIQGTNFQGTNLTGAKFCLAKGGLRPRYMILPILNSCLGGVITAGLSLLLFMGLFESAIRTLTMPLLIAIVLFCYLRLPQCGIKLLNIQGNRPLHGRKSPPETIAQDIIIALIVYFLVLYLLLVIGIDPSVQKYAITAFLMLSFAMIRWHIILALLLLFAHFLYRDGLQTAIAICGEKQGLRLGILPAYILSTAAVIGGMNFVYDVVAPHSAIPTTWIAYGCAIAVVGGSCWLMLLLALSKTRRSLHCPITDLSDSPTIILKSCLGATSFQQANLTGANFAGAFLVGSKFNQANLTDVHWGNAKGIALAYGLIRYPLSPLQSSQN